MWLRAFMLMQGNEQGGAAKEMIQGDEGVSEVEHGRCEMEKKEV